MDTIDEEFSYWFRGNNATKALKVYESEPDDTEEMICAYCGAVLDYNAMNCPDCGQKATILTEEDWSVDR